MILNDSQIFSSKFCWVNSKKCWYHIPCDHQFAQLAPEVAKRADDSWSCDLLLSNEILYRNSVPCFFVMMPPKYSSYTIWQFIPWVLQIPDGKSSRILLHIYHIPMVWTYPLNFHEVWSVDCHGMWSGFRTAGPLFGRKTHGPVIRRREDCATLRCKQQRMPEAAVMLEEVAKRTPPHPATLPLERIRMKETQKWRCLVMLCNNVLDMFR